MNKYELTEENKIVEGRRVHRIRALKFVDNPHRDVNVGSLGGWVENHSNLSQEGTCWIGEEGVVYDYSVVQDKAYIGDNAIVKCHGQVMGRGHVTGSALISDSIVDHHAYVGGKAIVSNSAEIGGYVRIVGNAVVRDVAMFGDFAIKEGIWKVAPANDYSGVFSASVVAPGYVRIGCEEHTLAGWRENFTEISKRHACTELQMTQAWTFLEYAEKWMIMHNMLGPMKGVK